MSNVIDPANEEVKHLANDNAPDEFCWLMKIPKEVLVKILNVLPPLTLVSFEDLGERMEMLTYDKYVISQTDFSSSMGLTPQNLVTFFRPQRTELITELNFSHCQNVPASTLQHCVLKCHNLCTLIVINCNFTLRMMSNIFSKLTHLVNLSWNMSCDTDEATGNCPSLFNLETLKMQVNNLKKLYLELLDYPSFLAVLNCFLSYTSGLQELHVRFSNCSQSSVEHQLREIERYLSYHGDYFNRKLDLPDLNSLIFMSDIVENDSIYGGMDVERICQIIELILGSRTPYCKWKRLWIEPYFCNERVEMFVNKEESSGERSCATICSLHNETLDDETFSDMVMLNKAAPDSIHTLKVALDLNPEIVQKIINAGGKRLKWLSIENINHPQRKKLSELLTELFTSCNNITELNFSGSHFTEDDHPCSVLCSLKYLSRLLLPSCAISHVSKKADDLVDFEETLHGLKKKQKVRHRNDNILYPLKDVVENCSLIEEFYVEGCLHQLCKTANTCTSEDFAVVYKWNNLKHLTLINLPNIMHANFLPLVAIQCKRFTSLHLEDVGNNAYCAYISDIIQMLKRSAYLKILSIKHKSFDIKSINLWKAMAEAQNLEQLCLMTTYNESVDVEVIVNAISKLKFLYIFHLHSRITNCNKLKSHVKLCLEDHNRKYSMDAKVVIEAIYYFLQETRHFSGHTHNFKDLGLLKTSIAQPKF